MERRNKVILVVEDDDSIRNGMVRAISEDGVYEVHNCENGIVAIDWLSKNPMPDLILTDFAMLGNGAEMVAIARRFNIPIIMLTADPDRALKALEALNVKIPVIPKPFDIFDVLSHVDRFTGTDPKLVEPKAA